MTTEDLLVPIDSLYSLKDLEEDQARELVSLARLPTWISGPDSGHGWGSALNDLLGGGVCPGYFIAVGAAYAGAGKTAWVMQIADGLALRNVELLRSGAPGPLTPVIICSEMAPKALTWRSLARWTGCPAHLFRAGGGGLDPARAQTVMQKARDALTGPLGDARRWIHIWKRTGLLGRVFWEGWQPR